MVRDHELYSNLSKVANSSFGSTGPGGAEANNRVSTQSIKFEVVDENTIKASYQSIVTFSSKSMLRDLETKYKQEALSMLKASMEKFSSDYEDLVSKEKLEVGPVPSGAKIPDVKKKVKLTVNDSTVTDSVEYIAYSMYSPVQRGFYRMSCLISVK